MAQLSKAQCIFCQMRLKLEKTSYPESIGLNVLENSEIVVVLWKVTEKDVNIKSRHVPMI